MHGTLSKAASSAFYYQLMVGAGLIIVLLLAAVLFGSAPFVESLIREGGPVETLSAAGYLIGIAAFFREGGLGYVKSHIYFPLIMMAMCMRELDFHNVLTTMSITKTRFYVSPEVPIMEKVLAVLVLAGLIWAGIAMVRRHWRQYLPALKRFDPAAVAFTIAGGCVVASKTLDGLPRKLGDFGYDMAAGASLVSQGFEEVLELGIPFFLTIAVFAYFGRPAHYEKSPARLAQ